MSFEKIDMRKWERKNEFLLFTKITPGFFSFTVDIDITNTYKMLKEKNLKFFPSVLYVLSHAVNAVPEFKIGYESHELVRYDELYPMFPYFHEETHSCSVLWLPVNGRFSEFHEEYMEYIEKYGGSTKYSIPMDKPVPKNVFTISVEHRIHFRSATMITSSQNPSEPAFYPVILCGKYEKKDGRYIMPVSFTIHHAVADGYHASLFFDNIQEMYSAPEEFV